jgi:FkbM family methyltransferase
VALPWGHRISIPADAIGRSIFLTGVFDLCLTEVIFRLLDSGEAAVDVGANIGYMTSVMSTRVGRSGTMLAFEPHPTAFQALQRNVARWREDPGIGTIEVHRLALSSRSGRGRLAVQQDFMALASLRDARESGDSHDVEVELATLDDAVGSRHVSLLKLDVEGHEHAVLEGATRLLAERRVRDVVFEDHGIYPTPAMEFLEHHGMVLFTIDQALRGPRIQSVEEGPAPPIWPGPNYLATRQPERALDRLRPRGWQCLRLGRRWRPADR